MLSETGYLEALAAERTIEAEGRVENLEELVGVAAEFDLNRELEGESEVAAAGGVPAADLPLHRPGRARATSEALVTLMTLHNAKGLEYDTVFIVGCEDGAFPHMRALEEGGEEEERRLCYVGITRARQRLYMTWARERRLFGRAERNLPSRFIDELPAELTERHSSAPGAAGGIGWEPAPAPAPAQPIDPGPALELQTGDDVVHASFGDGVVTGGRAGRRGRRPLLRRRHRAQADGRLRADPEAVAVAARIIDGKAVARRGARAGRGRGRRLRGRGGAGRRRWRR